MCKVAWADGSVDPSEREYVLKLIQRLGGQPVSTEELDWWLTEGVPEELARPLPENLEQFFFYEALQLAQADGDLDDREQEVVEGIMRKVFEPHDAGTTLVQIARVRMKPAPSNFPND